jgi:hypothetical protein
VPSSTRTAIFAGIATVGIATIAMADAIEVAFWGTEVAPPAGVELDGHPCGWVVLLETPVVPPDAPWMQADRVREIDAAGKIYRSWRVPMDLYPVGIEGDTLLLARGSDPIRFFAVDQQGHIRIPPNPHAEWLSTTSCPEQFKDFACVVIQDQPARYLAYSTVCT